VSANLKKLARDGLIDYEPYGSIGLTPPGNENRPSWSSAASSSGDYLVERLGLRLGRGPCRGALPGARRVRFRPRPYGSGFGHPDCDPHGDRIPRADGSIARSAERNSAARLSESIPALHGRIIRISDHKPEILQYLEKRKIAVGTPSTWMRETRKSVP